MKNIKKIENRFLWAISVSFLLAASPAMGGGVNTVGNYALFTAGALSTIGIHELGHAAAIELSGGNVEKIELFNNGILSAATYGNINELTPKKQKFVIASGLLTTSLLSEAIIQTKSLHNNAFAQGALSWSLASNIWHVKNFYFNRIEKDGWQGNDIDYYESIGGNPHILSALLLGYSAWAIYRIERNTKIIPLININLSF